MPDDRCLETQRLVLRRWREADRDALAALNADPIVMEHFPSTLTRERSDLMMDLIDGELEERGYGLWALETRGDGTLIGFAGLEPIGFIAHFTPAVEVGWRLVRGAWGHGYATEAGAAAIEHGFARAGLREIVSITSTTNARSMAVMERLGMRRDPADDFDHPRLPREHRLCRHVLYRIDADGWRVSRESGPRR